MDKRNAPAGNGGESGGGWLAVAKRTPSADCPWCDEPGRHEPLCPLHWNGPAELVPYAEQAIASGAIVDSPVVGQVLIPDLLNDERAAKGLPVASPTLVRGDGRSCAVYQKVVVVRR